jgi:hypothetical protein
MITCDWAPAGDQGLMGWQNILKDSSTYAPTSGDLGSETYTLQLIDYKDGGWGHISATIVTLNTAIPEPSSFALFMCGFLVTLARMRIRCENCTPRNCWVPL